MDVVGPAEIADMFGVHPVTVDRWRRDKILPDPDQVLRRGPLWERDTIIVWGEETGRTVHD